MPSLIASYFRVDNAYLNILHLPTFEKSVADGLHLRDELFATIVLLVCALGSRSSDDPRVLLDGSDDPHSAGWKWFRQAQLAYQVIGFEPTSLYDLQIICVSPASIGSSSGANMQAVMRDTALGIFPKRLCIPASVLATRRDGDTFGAVSGST